MIFGLRALLREAHWGKQAADEAECSLRTFCEAHSKPIIL